MILMRKLVHRVLLSVSATMLLLLSTTYGRTGLPTVHELFQRSQESLQTLDFEGKIAFMVRSSMGNQIREARVLRKAPDKWRVDLIWAQADRGIVTRLYGERGGRIQGESSIRRSPSPYSRPDRITRFPVVDAQLLLRNYNVRVLDGDPVAGRNTYLVEVEPKLVGRPSMRLWMDTETGIVLKMEKYSPQRWLEGFFVYSEINFNPDIDEAVFRNQETTFDRSAPGRMRGREEVWNHRQGELDLAEVRKKIRLDVIFPERVPGGFVLQSVQLMKLRTRESVHLVYTDGLDIISVFQSLSDERTRGGWSERSTGRVEKISIDGIECMVISTRPSLIFRWRQGGVSLTLIGELERKEMVEFVRSFVGKGRNTHFER